VAGVVTTGASDSLDPQPDEHVLLELGFGLDRVGDELHCRAPAVPEMFVPGTTSVRTSILATFADVTAGCLAVDVLAPRVPVTLELDVHLYEPVPACESIHAVGRIHRAGRAVVVAGVGLRH
jgi:acyl-coenzyme A thioesterase PaaI-like protein